jgi:hypothetical protein
LPEIAGASSRSAARSGGCGRAVRYLIDGSIYLHLAILENGGQALRLVRDSPGLNGAAVCRILKVLSSHRPKASSVCTKHAPHVTKNASKQ